MAQQASPEDEQRAIDRALAELEGRRREVAAWAELHKADQANIAGLLKLVDDQAALIEEWKAAARERATANGADAKLEASYKASVEAYEKELARVRGERDAANRAKKWWAVGGFVVGVGLAILAGRGGS